MKFPFIAVASLIVFVTLVANFGASNSVLRFVQLIPGKDLTGHFCLYAALGFTLSLWIRMQKFNRALIGLVAAGIVAEEFSQMFIGHRTFSLKDLAASLAGFSFGVFSIRAFFSNKLLSKIGDSSS